MSGNDQMINRRWSARQRIVILTFADRHKAEAWDRAGQWLDDIVQSSEVDVNVLANDEDSEPERREMEGQEALFQIES